MSLLVAEGFDYYATAQLPALWDSASGVTINQAGGRNNGGAAVFVGSGNPSMVKTISGDTYAYLGLAFRLTAVTGTTGITIAKLTTNHNTFTLKLTNTGVLVVYQGSTQVCASPKVVQLNKGIYIELKVRTQTSEQSSVVLRANGSVVLGRGQIAGFTSGEVFTTLTLGGGTSETGTWLVDDVYLCNSTAESQFQMGQNTVDNAGFLGNVKVQGLFATQDGFATASGVDPAYTPWTPNTGTVHYDRVNEHPPTGDTSYESTDAAGTYNSGAHTLNAYATYQFTHPLQGIDGFALRPQGGLPWPMFGVHWVGDLRLVSGTGTVKATDRRVNTIPSSDAVAISSALTLSTSYDYYEIMWDRNPIDQAIGGGPEWTFRAVFLRTIGGNEGFTEFGVMRAS